MATDILVESVTNGQLVNNEWKGTGVFDKLMEAVNKNIESQYQKNRIKGADYAQVYLGSIQAVLQQSMQYVLQEQITEAQVDGIEADNLLKAKQLEIAEQELAIKLEQLEIEKEKLKNLYVERVLKDKQVAELGLDEVVKNANTSPEPVYTPKYEEV